VSVARWRLCVPRGEALLASVLLDAGENIKVVAENLGHADAGFTLRICTHTMPEGANKTRSAVDAAFACYMSATSGPKMAVPER
jgi:integrase